MKTHTLDGMFSLRCLDQRFSEVLVVDKKKILLGSSDKCDFRLVDPSISSAHAFLCQEGEGFLIKDLYSESGVFINGTRVQDGKVFHGDTLTIGNVTFQVECLDEDFKVFNPDESIKIVPQNSSFVEIPQKEGLVFIDDEYCDIKFDDSTYKPLHSIPHDFIPGEYVELDETETPVDIVVSNEKKKLEVINYVNGLMIEIQYLDLVDGDYYLSPVKKSKFDIVFSSLEKTKFFSIQNGQFQFSLHERLIPSVSLDMLNLDEAFFFSCGTEQISLRLVEHSTSIKGIPAFLRDREFFKEGSKVFASVFLPMLLLLFVTVTKKEEVKEEIAVVYTLPQKVQKAQEDQEKSDLKAETLTSKTENSGHKENEQNPTKVEFAKASQSHKAVAQAAAAATSRPQPAAVKSYEFKSSVAFDSIVGDASSINTNKSGSKTGASNSQFKTGSADNGPLVDGADIGVSKLNGSDKAGSGAVSSGSRGLASKSGFDSSYLEPKTVILGSMDPELLRKILREYIPQFRHCYQQELIANSDKIKGVIDLNFTISAVGKVSKYNIKVKDADFSQKGVGCMGQVLSVIEFPKPKGGGVVDVRQPLNFFAETEKI